MARPWLFSEIESAEINYLQIRGRVNLLMPPKKKRVLEGSDGPDGHMFYVDSDFLIHYGPGQRALCRMSVTDYTEIVEIGPGKVAKKPKEITKELVISRILSHLSKTLLLHLHGCR